MLQLFSLALSVLVISAFHFEGEANSAPEIVGELRRTDMQATEEERIVSGTSATDGQFPYATALVNSEGSFCTASILSKRTILTAAHCVVLKGKKQLPTAFWGVIGAADRTSGNAVNISFEDLTVHEDYNAGSFRNDIAILRTTAPIRMSDKIAPVVIASQETGLNYYKTATVMGWGTTSRFNRKYPDVLEYRDVVILNHMLCIFRYPETVTDQMMCADGFGGGICYGDSGGPMVHISRDGKHPAIQIGIASFVRAYGGCGSLIVNPGVETRVSSYEQWIKKNSNDSEIRSAKYEDWPVKWKMYF